MIEIVDAYTRSGKEWCTCCQKKENTKRIKFSQDGSQGISVVLCDDCRRELVRVIAESEQAMTKKARMEMRDEEGNLLIGGTITKFQLYTT